MPNGSTLPRQERGAIVQQIDVEQDCLGSKPALAIIGLWKSYLILAVLFYRLEVVPTLHKIARNKRSRCIRDV